MKLTFDEKKAIIKRSADALEKLAIGSALVGLFKNVPAGIFVFFVCMIASYALTIWEKRL